MVRTRENQTQNEEGQGKENLQEGSFTYAGVTRNTSKRPADQAELMQDPLEQLLEILELCVNPRGNQQATAILGLEQFWKLTPLTFSGNVDPLVAEDWILQMEKIFTVLNCTKEQKVSFVAFIFRGEDEHWWRATLRLERAAQRQIDWDRFVELMNKKYILEGVRDKWAIEF